MHLLGIIKSARGSGLAQRMMDIMEEEARKGGYQAQVLDVIPGNLPAENCTGATDLAWRTVSALKKAGESCGFIFTGKKWRNADCRTV